MSKHVWECKRFNTDTLGKAWTGLRFVFVDNGRTPEEAFRFVGYWLERCRQATSFGLVGFWKTCEKSKHRYATGINCDNYLRAGRALCEACAYRVNVDEGTPAEIILDKMKEEGA